MPFFYFDSTMLLLIPAMILAFYAQSRVQGAYTRYARVAASSGASGAQVARLLLDKAGLDQVAVEMTSGNLTDHYDPRKQTVRLSRAVYSSNSLAALGIAAHETGHAVQHSTGFFALSLRNNFFPVAQLGSNLAMPMFLIGFFFANNLGIFMDIGIMLFVFAVLFQVITLPVEFNASSRAVDMLLDNGVVTRSEESAVRTVLNAAALTYVAATAVAVSHLLRLLILRGRRR